MTTETKLRTAHTPGPWTALIDGPRARRSSLVTTHAANTRAMSIDCTRSGNNYTEDEANARLIAASPRMYDYIAKRAEEGDKDAAEIIARISK